MNGYTSTINIDMKQLVISGLFTVKHFNLGMSFYSNGCYDS